MWAQYVKASEENVTDLVARIDALRAQGESTLVHFAVIELRDERGRLAQLRKLAGE